MMFITKVQYIRLLSCPRELLTLDGKLTNLYIDDTHTVERQGIILFYTKCLKDYNKHLPYTHKIQTQKENLEKPQPQKQSIMGLG